MNDFTIEMIGLCKQFGKKKALSALSAQIPENSITGLIGRNGSGKTTLLKILAGRLDSTSGEVRVFGENPMDNLSVQERIVYSYHNVGYAPKLTLGSILYEYHTMFGRFDMEFANKLLKYFDLTGKLRYQNLSQGMGGTFNFICALACRAPLTMLDEPVLGMDVTVRKSVYEILLRDYAEHPRTFIISSHLFSELEGILTDALLIEQGELVLHNSLDDMRQSAYRLDGDKAALAAFMSGRRVIATKQSELQSFAVVYEPLTESVVSAAKAQGLEISPVRPEDLCIYLTKQNKKEEIECLW